MSNLATADRLRTAFSQLPVSWYCDPAIYALRSELFEFEQVFDQPGRSRGVLRLRATLEGNGVWAQRTFAIEKPAPTADAPS